MEFKQVQFAANGADRVERSFNPLILINARRFSFPFKLRREEKKLNVS